MNRLPIVLALTTGLILSSCAKKTPDFVNSIPDNAIAVVSLQPMQLHTKSKINTFKGIKEKVKDEIWGQLIENPLSTGLMLNEYTYVFGTMEDKGLLIGVVSGMKDLDKFLTTLSKIEDDIKKDFNLMEGYTYIQPDSEGIIAWNEEKMIVLASPDSEEFETSFLTGKLDWMFNPVKEESITSLVDFKDFHGKMKDLNLWVSSNDMKKVIEKILKNDLDVDIPVELLNNYAQVYCDFADGQMNITGETHFSEEVEKNIEEFLVMNPSLNEDMLKLAPAGNLLLAVAGSMDLEKVQKMVGKFAPPKLDEMGNKVEAVTGIPTEDLLNSFTGDFTIAINGLEGEVMIPVEVFIGFGVNGKAIQEKLMENVQGMLPVEEQGDFFVIKIQGNQIYSGIVDDLWVITNAKDYKDKISGGSYDKSLVDSRFGDFADGSVGMYVNLDLANYPSMIKGLMDQNPNQKRWIERLTDPFDYLGISAGNYQKTVTLKTNKPNENSLYTILKVTETSKVGN